MSTITATITTTVSAIPLLRHRDTVVNFPADQDDFVAKYEATNDHLSNTTVAQLNAVGNEIDIVTGQINTVSGEVNTNAGIATTKATLAADYAEKMALEVETGTYSSKEHAIGDLTLSGGSAKAWAVDASSPNGTSDKSAKTLASEASVSAAAALVSENAAAALLDSFDDRYLGAKASAPTLDNDGNPLVSGALYYNTTSDVMFVYDLELTTWISLTFTPTDHGSLSGLADDDHSQYHNDARGDARYYTKTLLDSGQLDNRYYTETELNSLLSAKQASLVSGTNIKTINGGSVLGSGDIVVGGYAVGDILTTKQALSTPTWIPCTGVYYDETVYTSLAATLGQYAPEKKLTDLNVMPPSGTTGISFSFDDVYMAISSQTTPFIDIYKRSGDVFTKLADPSTLPTGTASGCSFSRDGIYLAVVHDTSPFITVYKRSGDVFTKLADPSTLPTGTASGCSFSPDGIYLSVAHITTPFITVYKRSGDVFTKLADPSTLPTSNGKATQFSPDGIYLSLSCPSTPWVYIYKIITDVVTLSSNPTMGYSPTGVNGAYFSQNSSYLCVCTNTTPWVKVYKRSGDVFTAISAQPTATSFVDSADFSSNGKYLYLGIGNSTNGLFSIDQTNDTFTSLNIPLILGRKYGSKFSYNSKYLGVTLDSSPNFAIFGGSYHAPTIDIDASITDLRTYIKTGL